MVRGIERTAIVRDAADRADFVERLARLAAAGALTVYAWALLPNHAHLLVHTGSRPLARTMRSLLTGYTGAFNRRHKRVGHLFQNRYKSVVVEEEPYLLELVRYLHLNPLRAALVPDVRALDRFPLRNWSSASASVVIVNAVGFAYSFRPGTSSVLQGTHRGPVLHLLLIRPLEKLSVSAEA